MKITVVSVTFHRLHLSVQAIPSSRKTAGRKWDEFIWVDNGSPNADIAVRILRPDVAVLNKTNLGCPRGYNTGFILAHGDAICIFDDRGILPSGWLKAMADVLDNSDVGAVSIYDENRYDTEELHLPGEDVEIAGHRCSPAMVFGCILFRAELLRYGYWREDFGLYGHCDVEWAQRLAHHGVTSLVLRDFIKTRLDEPLDVDGEDYGQWKRQQAVSKQHVFDTARNDGYPRYTPFRQTE